MAIGAIGEVRSLNDVAATKWADYWQGSLEVSDRNGGNFKLPGRPWKFSDSLLPLPGDPALQGEHNLEVLTSLGYSEDAINRLQDDGALVGNFASMMIASIMAQMPQAAPEAEDAEDKDDT